MEGHVTTVMHSPVGIDAERVGRDMSVISSVHPLLVINLGV